MNTRICNHVRALRPSTREVAMCMLLSLQANAKWSSSPFLKQLDREIGVKVTTSMWSCQPLRASFFPLSYYQQ
jgi:hypothetical protein